MDEPLEGLENTIDIAIGISVMYSLGLCTIFTAFTTSTTISDTEWNPILANEYDLLSAVIKANKSQHASQNRRKVIELIACEFKGMA